MAVFISQSECSEMVLEDLVICNSPSREINIAVGALGLADHMRKWVCCNLLK